MSSPSSQHMLRGQRPTPPLSSFDHVEIRKGTYHAGIYEEGCNNAIIGSYVHDNGMQDRNEDNGNLLVGDFSGLHQWWINRQ